METDGDLGIYNNRRQTMKEKDWCVRFVGDYFSLITNVLANNEEQAVELAIAQLKDYHGFDVEGQYHEMDAFDMASEENS